MHAPHAKKSSSKSSLHALDTTYTYSRITFLGVDHEWAAPERQRGMHMPPEWPRALHNAQIGKTPNLEGPSRSGSDGRSSAEVAQYQSVLLMDLAISFGRAQIALFPVVAEARGDRPESTVPSLGAGAVSP